MSTIDFVVEQAAARTGGTPEAVRSLISIALNHIPEGTTVDRNSMAMAMEATRKDLKDPELHSILDRVEEQFSSMGMLKQILVFSTLNSGIEDARRELRG